MDLDDAIADLETEFLNLSAHLSGETLEAIKPQIRAVAARYSPHELHQKLQRCTSSEDPHNLQSLEKLLLRLMLEQQFEANCTECNTSSKD